MAHKNNTKASPLMRVLKAFYWIIFAVALIIVLVYAAFKIFVTDPDVGNEHIINTPPVVSGDPDNTNTQDPVNTESQPVESPSPLVLHRVEGVYTCLLAGTDDGNGCADTLMLGVFNTNDKTATLLSIPRDTLVVVNGANKKINATYAAGGMELVCQAVEELLAIPVDYYVSVDLQAFVKIVDQVGGVWFTVPQDMQYSDPYQDLYIDLKAGYQLLDGEHALQLMRYRAGYANQDIGRSQTQRAFLVTLVKQSITLSNVSKVSSLIETLNRYVDSDMPLKDMIFFATEAVGMDLTEALQSTSLPGDWVTPYWELREDEVVDIVNSLGIYEEEVPVDALGIHHNAQ